MYLYVREGLSSVLDQAEDAAIPLLRRGNSGAVVQYLQHLLNLWSRRTQSRLTSLKEDGVYGRKTELRVRLFQRQTALRSDGVTNVKTWGRLIGMVGLPLRFERDPSRIRLAIAPALGGPFEGSFSDCMNLMTGGFWGKLTTGLGSTILTVEAIVRRRDIHRLIMEHRQRLLAAGVAPEIIAAVDTAVTDAAPLAAWAAAALAAWMFGITTGCLITASAEKAERGLEKIWKWTKKKGAELTGSIKDSESFRKFVK